MTRPSKQPSNIFLDLADNLEDMVAGQPAVVSDDEADSDGLQSD